jgi:hypothetical protein
MVMLQEGLDLRCFCLPPRLCANVAQLVEQRFRKARVVSSILTVGSTSKPLKKPPVLRADYDVWPSLSQWSVIQPNAGE